MTVAEVRRIAPEPEVVFEWVKPEDVSRVWDLVLPGIQKVAAHDRHWRPEDVYMALRQGTSVLHCIRHGGVYCGSIVTTQVLDHDGLVLHVWSGFSDPDGVNLHEATMAQLREWGASIGARYIRFASPRRGWDKLARKLGFEPTLITYECEVAP